MKFQVIVNDKVNAELENAAEAMELYARRMQEILVISPSCMGEIDEGIKNSVEFRTIDGDGFFTRITVEYGTQ